MYISKRAEKRVFVCVLAWKRRRDSTKKRVTYKKKGKYPPETDAPKNTSTQREKGF